MSLDKAVTGDVVLITGTGWGTEIPKRATVIKAMKLRVVLDDGSVWKRSGGPYGGSVWDRHYCRPRDQQLFDEIKKKHEETVLKNKVTRFFSDRQCNSLSLDQWERVDAICSEQKERGE